MRRAVPAFMTPIDCARARKCRRGENNASANHAPRPVPPKPLRPRRVFDRARQAAPAAYLHQSTRPHGRHKRRWSTDSRAIEIASDYEPAHRAKAARPDRHHRVGAADKTIWLTPSNAATDKGAPSSISALMPSPCKRAALSASRQVADMCQPCATKSGAKNWAQ